MKGLVLHSGGLDSTVCVLLALEAKREVVSLGIDYGQRHRIELEYALAQCRQYEIERRVLRIEWDKPVRNIPIGRSVEQIRSQVSPAFLPGRNAVFLSLACAEAAGIGAEEVWIGVNAIDFSGYPDCKPEFIEAFDRMITIAIPQGLRLVAPLLRMSKPQIAAEARRLGLTKSETWSCYQPQFTAKGISPCQQCDACILHEHAWQPVNHKPGASE
jgi:7-cyano-7-deazaguanine synthase